MLDLDYAEDSQAETDMNVVMNNGGGFVEVQGTAEGHAFRRHELDALLDLAAGGMEQLFALQAEALQVAMTDAGPAPRRWARYSPGKRVVRVVLASSNAGKLRELPAPRSARTSSWSRRARSASNPRRRPARPSSTTHC